MQVLYEERYSILARAAGRVASEVEFLERGVNKPYSSSTIQAALQYWRDSLLALTFVQSRRIRPSPLYIALSLETLDPKEFASKLPRVKPHIIAPQKLNSHLCRSFILAFAVACDTGPGLVGAVLESEEFSIDFAGYVRREGGTVDRVDIRQHITRNFRVTTDIRVNYSTLFTKLDTNFSFKPTYSFIRAPEYRNIPLVSSS